MAQSRQVGVLDGTGRACVISEELPLLKKGMVLVKVHASLISPGTELNSARTARRNPNTEPGEAKPFGYQNAGEIIEAGEGVSRFQPGDRVACMGGGYALHSNYVTVPQNLCAMIPERVSYEEASFAHLAMTSLHAIRRGQPQLGEYLLVAGLGLVGQMAARIGQIAGMYVMGWDMLPFRCNIAKGWGIDDVAVIDEEAEAGKAKAFTRDFGFDMAVVAFGGKGAKALESVKKVMKMSVDTHEMGRICVVGALSTETRWATGMGNLDVRSCARTGAGYHDEAWEHGEYEYPPCFMRWNTRTNMEYVLRLMSEGKLDVKRLITHRLPLAQIDEAVTAHIEHPETALGTVLLMEHME